MTTLDESAALAIAAPVGAETTRPTSIWRRVQRDALLLGAGNVGIVIAQLGFRSILLVALVPSAYGRLSLILSLYNTIFLIGASGLPNSVARYISVCSPSEDAKIVRSAIRAGLWPTAIAAVVMAVVSGVFLASPWACLFAAIGLSSLVYSLLSTGILRGRRRVVAAASIQPIGAVAEVTPLVALWLSGLGVTPLSAFAVFCFGNLVGLGAGVFCTARTAPRPAEIARSSASLLDSVPNARQLLGFSLWLAAATIGIAAMPLVMRFAAALDSYTVVAMIDVALVLLSIPQRIGTVIVQAVIPHATRAIGSGEGHLTISRREHLLMIVPFVLAATVVAFTPLVGLMFGVIGRPEYANAAGYLALALLAGPARILYGLVQGILVAHGEGRFLARNSLSITVLASAGIFAAAALGSTMAAFAIFVAACWAVYLNSFLRAKELAGTSPLQPSEA
jgi:O-antigen/teichoic acid export membrane protein